MPNMTDDDIANLKKLADGWRGTFRWMAYEDSEEGIEYLAPDADPEDPDADDATMVHDMDQYVSESLAELINGGKAAIAELARLRGVAK